MIVSAVGSPYDTHSDPKSSPHFFPQSRQTDGTGPDPRFSRSRLNPICEASDCSEMKMTLGKSIVLLLVGSLLGTALLLGGVAFITTRNSITNLRSDLLKQVDLRVQQRMQDYFDRAGPALDFMEKAVFAEEDFMNGWEDRARLLSDYLMTEPDIVWI